MGLGVHTPVEDAGWGSRLVQGGLLGAAVPELRQSHEAREQDCGEQAGCLGGKQ